MTRAIAGMILALAAVCPGAEYNNTYQKTFVVGNGGKVAAENVNGAIHVIQGSGNQVVLTVREHWKADSEQALADARQRFRVADEMTGNGVRIYLDIPNRDGEYRRGNNLSFRHDFEITVPRGVLLSARSVNGAVTSKGVEGVIDLHTVNGSIEVDGTASGGELKTVNGSIDADFVRNPSSKLSVHTVNGSIALRFPQTLNADVNISMLHGKILTDFDGVSQASGGFEETTERGQKMYRARKSTQVRIGGGGTPIDIHTVNGEVKILKRGQ